MLSLRVTPEAMRALNRAARLQKVSRGEVVNNAIAEHLASPQLTELMGRRDYRGVSSPEPPHLKARARGRGKVLRILDEAEKNQD